MDMDGISPGGWVGLGIVSTERERSLHELALHTGVTAELGIPDRYNANDGTLFYQSGK